MNNIIIIGGDKRQSELNKILSAGGLNSRHINSSDAEIKIKTGDIIILPVPLSKDKENIYSSDSGFNIKIKDVLNKTDETNVIFAGGFSDAVKAYLEEKNIEYSDYLDSEETVLYNAYLTGLGAVRLVLNKICEDITDKKVLVTGFGRVAEFSAQALKRIGCDVYVTARNRLQLLRAGCIGYKTIDFKKRGSFLYLFDYIFNTVPENIFSQKDVAHIKGKYIELASAPYGAKKELFINRENDYIDGGALPGRYLSHSAAEKLAEITLEYLNLRNGGD